MQAQPAASQGASRIPNPYFAYGAPAGFALLTDDAGVYLGTKTIRVNRKALEEYLQSAQQMAVDIADGGDDQ